MARKIHKAEDTPVNLKQVGSSYIYKPKTRVYMYEDWKVYAELLLTDTQRLHFADRLAHITSFSVDQKTSAIYATIYQNFNRSNINGEVFDVKCKSFKWKR
jgi:hypothetical protein